MLLRAVRGMEAAQEKDGPSSWGLQDWGGKNMHQSGQEEEKCTQESLGRPLNPLEEIAKVN